MTAAGLLLIAAALAGYPLARHVRRQGKRIETLRAERDECLIGWTDALTLCGEWSGLNTKTQGLVDHWRREAEWARMKHTIALAELDRVTERHAVLLTLDGIRADIADGIRYDGAEPPLSVSVRASKVTPIRRGAK